MSKSQVTKRQDNTEGARLYMSIEMANREWKLFFCNCDGGIDRCNQLFVRRSRVTTRLNQTLGRFGQKVIELRCVVCLFYQLVGVGNIDGGNAGTYELGDERVTIEVTDGKLYADAEDAPRIELRPLAANHFIGTAFEFVDVQFVFRVNQDGSVGGLRVAYSFNDDHFSKVAAN